MDLEMMCETTLSRHRERLHEAARRAQLRSDESNATRKHSTRSLRWSLAVCLRRMADALEPKPAERRVLLLRAVSHGEIDVEQAMRLLEPANGHRLPS